MSERISALTRRSVASALLVLLGLALAGAPPAHAKKKPPAAPININTANEEQLQQVPGIGPATAKKIAQMRKSYGPFKSVDDLLAIKGMGPKRLEKMRKYLTVGKAEAKKNSQPGNPPATKQPTKEGESPPRKRS